VSSATGQWEKTTRLRKGGVSGDYFLFTPYSPPLTPDPCCPFGLFGLSGIIESYDLQDTVRSALKAGRSLMARTELLSCLRRQTVWLLVFLNLALILQAQSIPEITVDLILDRAYQRFTSYQDFGRWQVLVVSSQNNADRHWQPEKIRRVTKWMKFDGELLDEEILEAIEIEKGRTRDITGQYRQQRLERLKQMREEREKARASGRSPEDRLTLSLQDLIPFSDKNRNRYDFILRGVSEINGDGVYLVEARARERKDFLFEGLFYISRDSYDLRRVEITPLKTPAFVREFLLEVDLDLWRESLVMRKVKIKIYGRFLFRSIRRIIDEDYLEYRPLD